MTTDQIEKNEVKEANENLDEMKDEEEQEEEEEEEENRYLLGFLLFFNM